MSARPTSGGTHIPRVPVTSSMSLRNVMSCTTSITPATGTTKPNLLPRMVPNLISATVKASDLQCPDYCFRITVDFSCTLKPDPGVLDIKKVITGLLNTSGGLLEIMNQNGRAPETIILDKWKLKFENALERFIPYDVCRACIHMHDYSYPLKIWVNKSSKVITLNSHLYVRGMAGNRVVNMVECIRDVISMCSRKPFQCPLKDYNTILYGSIMPVGEGANLEFKCWNSVETFTHDRNKDTYLSRLGNERTQRTLFSLPNMENGGFLIIGVKEDTTTKNYVIVGQVISNDDKVKFENHLNTFLSSNSQMYPEGWGHGCRSLECGRDWTIRFIPVTGGPQGKSRSLIVIHLNHFPGGVWEACPESFLISEAGHVLPMSFSQWKFLILSNISPQKSSDPIKMHQGQPDAENVSTQQGAMSEQLSTYQGKRDTSHYMAATSNIMHSHNSPHVVENTSSSKVKTENTLKKKLRRWKIHKKYHVTTHKKHVEHIATRKYISWTQNRRNWDSIINYASVELEKDAQKFAGRTKLFRMTTQTNLLPSRNTLIAGHQYDTALLEKALDHISSREKCKSFGFASSKWIGNIRTEMHMERPEHHILDVFIMYETGQIKIWGIVDEDAFNYGDIWAYLYRTGRVTARELLIGQVTSLRGFVSSIDVECCLYHLKHGEVISKSSTNIVPKPVMNNLQDIMVCVARTILKKETHLKSIFGDDRSIILTEEQMDVILSLGLDKFNFIEGPPGSGKTFVALRLCQQYKCGYIYANDTFGKFLKFQGVENRFMANKSEMLQSHIDNGVFEGLDYLIADDVQNLNYSETTWFSLFEYISAQNPKTKLVIFGDSFYQNFMGRAHRSRHKSLQYLLAYCGIKNYNPVTKSLSVIHRNHRKIAAFIKSNFENNPNYPQQSQITCSHSEDGDDVEIKYLVDVMRNDKQNNLVDFVQKLTNPQRPLGQEKQTYEPRDVAIMVDTQNAEIDAPHLRKVFHTVLGEIAEILVHDAGTFPVTGYTIDTLENFMGFDRRLCVLVASEETLQSEQDFGRSLANPRYRTFVASRGISRVIFVVHSELKTSDVAKFRLEWEHLTPVTTRLWHLEENRIVPELCFLNVRGQTSVLYSARNDRGGTDVRVVTMEGAAVPVTVDSLDMKLTWRTASSGDEKVALAGWDDVYKGPWSWQFLMSRHRRIKKVQRFSLSAPPWSVCWSHDGSVLILLNKLGVLTLSKMSPSDGQTLWRRDKAITHFSDPSRLTVCPSSGTIYASDEGCIRELAPDGHHKRDIPTIGISEPFAICVNSTGRALFLSDYKDSESDDIMDKAVFLIIDGGNPIHVLRAPGRVCDLCLHADRFLGVATERGLALYDVAQLL